MGDNLLDRLRSDNIQDFVEASPEAADEIEQLQARVEAVEARAERLREAASCLADVADKLLDQCSDGDGFESHVSQRLYASIATLRDILFLDPPQQNKHVGSVGEHATAYRATVAALPDGERWCVTRDGEIVARSIPTKAAAERLAKDLASTGYFEVDAADPGLPEEDE